MTSTQPICVYTAVIGDYDDLPSVRAYDSAVEFIAVSDRTVSKHPWKPIGVDRYWEDNKITSGYIKTHPHLFCPPGSISVWVDANLNELKIHERKVRSSVAINSTP